MTAQTSPSRSSRISAIKTIVLCLLAGLFSTAFAEDWDGSTSKPSSKEIDGVEYYNDSIATRIIDSKLKSVII